ncbi:histone acetyltransferase esa1 [Terfezia boudieri ATCC MYA-4762]|uniref:Histone acetyltransferase ESA1 n=1 Tax=Terfezia boudieri ATCC MYA-4762 TaxID=1051890 RepID=A0A3N4LW07_9PEZI|nr:histone acetyltransferase esa1 [Terfezia boudieri ATCC MYA-4762]
MVTRDASADVGTPGVEAVPREKGMATLEQLRIGVKLHTLHGASNEHRLAEILSIQTRKGQPYYYVHYEEFNKRLDEWVPADRFDLTREVEFPLPDAGDAKKAGHAVSPAPPVQKNLKRGRAVGGGRDSITSIAACTPVNKRSRRALGSSPPPPAPKAESVGLGEGGDSEVNTTVVAIPTEDIDSTPIPEDDGDTMDLDKEKDQKALDPQSAPPARTGHGSMSKSTNEISKVRNLSQIQIGQHLVEPWYFSPYPVEFTEEDTIYICEFCLSFFATERVFARHRQKCTLLHPPGNEIYRDDAVSFFEVDGRRQRTWARNLSLLSKLFLDHKTVYSDVDPFLFYCMCTRDAFGCHLVGYFSKEKGSPDGYNVACILTLPQYQRSGYGRLLIEFSYTLSKREGKQGSPEKPLSDLGLLSYRAYWQETVVDALLETKGEVTVDELAQRMAMTPADVLHTLLSLNALKFYKGQHVICLTDAVIAQKEKQKEKQRVKGKRCIFPEKLIWKPPVFMGAWNW